MTKAFEVLDDHDYVLGLVYASTLQDAISQAEDRWGDAVRVVRRKQ